MSGRISSISQYASRCSTIVGRVACRCLSMVFVVGSYASISSTIVLPDSWIEHRREDGETVGWIVIDGDGFRPVDILGRQVAAEPVDWLDAEQALNALGIGFLADRYFLRLADGSERPVRITEASIRGVTVVADEFGSASAVGANSERFLLPFPAPEELRTAAE